ncbi:MAG: PhzF family phenazine biosynthesis protein, partial [Rhodothermales bacterium]|nr:PhzF family phenazine biosynthesis protein [Rhodothermales bacterium]
RETIAFDTLSGRLEVTLGHDRIEMDFPAEKAEATDVDDLVREAVGTYPLEVHRNRLDYLVVLESEHAVETLRPNLDAVARLGSRGMIVTAASGQRGYDFVSRYFAPQYGIPEDPVTGSAHCCLGPFWSEALGKDHLTGFQASARGGTVHVASRGDRVTIGGNAVTTARIELYVNPE